MSLLGDLFRKQFGFPLKQESYDHKINNYRVSDKINVEHSIADRNVAISFVSEQIRQIKVIIDDNQFFVDSYNLIKNAAIDKVREGDCPLQETIYKIDGLPFITANLKTINDYFCVVKSNCKDYMELQNYNLQMSKALETIWQRYANNVINNKGEFRFGTFFDTEYSIYTAYMQIKNSLSFGKLKDCNRKTISLSSNNLELVIQASKLAEECNNILYVLLQDLNSELSILNDNQASDEYVLQVIDNTKKMMSSTMEYLKAKKNKEFIETHFKKKI